MTCRPTLWLNWFTVSERDGWRFVRRLADVWAAGTNRFDRPGEALFAARVEGSILGF